ncbi:MAG TPA: hypothetical protein VM843_03900 [Flavisolibacter sp.]|nr:hypothetical protein [Flavisolibacter sp.]
MNGLNSPASMNKKKAGVIVLSALAATAAAYLLSKKKNASTSAHEKPPKGAPQLDIENPGSQHDFPKPPTQSQMG